MKKRKSELIRVQNIIQSSRVKVEDSFFDLLVADVSKLLKDYFVFNKTPEVRIEKNGGEYSVSIDLSVIRIKNFSTLPK